MDIRASLPDGTEKALLATVGQRVVDEFPIIEERWEYAGRITLGPQADVQTQGDKKFEGYIFCTSDKKNHQFQSRMTGFTYNKLAPYDRWESFRNKAKELWLIYRELVRPTRVTRIALRYVNRITIPRTRVELQEYFRTYPEISSDLPQELQQFVMRLQLPQPDLGAIAQVHQATLPSRGATSILLDIDVFKQDNIPEDEEEMWLYLEQLRLRKNKIFESCLTAKTRELFD